MYRSKIVVMYFAIISSFVGLIIALNEDSQASVGSLNLQNILKELELRSEIAKNLISSVIQANEEEIAKREELAEELVSQTVRETKQPRRVVINSLKGMAVEDDEKIITSSLANLSTSFLTSTNCGICCNCRNSVLLARSGVNPGGLHCTQYILNEIERILDTYCSSRAAAEPMVEDESRVLSGIFGKSAGVSFSISDLTKRIVEISADHMVLKCYLIILLDSTLIDLCNSYSCDLCRSLYASNSFGVYRVVRAVNAHTKYREMGVGNMPGLQRIRTALKSVQDVRNLLMTLERIFGLVEINSSMYNLMKQTIGGMNPAAVYNMRTEPITKALLSMFDLAVVLNATDNIYYFMQPDGALIPIPNVYNMSTMVYDRVAATSVNTNNLLNYVSTYVGDTYSSKQQQEQLLNTLRNGGISLRKGGNVQVKVTHTIPAVVEEPMFAPQFTAPVISQFSVPQYQPSVPQVNTLSSGLSSMPPCQKKDKKKEAANMLIEAVAGESVIQHKQDGMMTRSVHRGVRCTGNVCPTTGQRSVRFVDQQQVQQQVPFQPSQYSQWFTHRETAGLIDPMSGFGGVYEGVGVPIVSANSLYQLSQHLQQFLCRDQSTTILQLLMQM